MIRSIAIIIIVIFVIRIAASLFDRRQTHAVIIIITFRISVIVIPIITIIIAVIATVIFEGIHGIFKLFDAFVLRSNALLYL